MQESVVILHNIRSTHNVGSIFRTADAAGVAKLYLTGYTPAPVDRFGRVQKEIIKTALGAQDYVPWEQGTVQAVVRKLKKEGYTVVAVEQDARAVSLATYTAPKRVAFIFGNEVRGVSPQLRAQCDEIVEIPMRGRKESLNVSVTAGVVLFHTHVTSAH